LQKKTKVTKGNPAMGNIIKNFIKYVRNKDGLVTIEWVGIAAVVVLAAIVITAAIMHQTQALGGSVMGQQATVGAAVDAASPTVDLDFTPTPPAP
jgi:hypothetical protein